jgi:hypothetical protein
MLEVVRHDGYGRLKPVRAGILAKLGLRDRTQAAVFAYETGLVRPGERMT